MKLDIEITGITPLLMNRFNIDEQKLKKDKDITPREAAQKVCYIDEKERLYYPTTNIYACLIEAGKFHKDGKVKVTTARSSLIPAGVMIENEIVYFKTPSTWEVDSRAVVVPSTGGRIVCHRPRLDEWSIEFTLSVDLKMFSPKFIRTLVDDAGSKVGLGDFRPARKGIYGRFVVTNWEERKD
jgi:hypothetical protein